MPLFKKGKFELHSGEISNFKIDCDALTDEDIETLAYIISQNIKFFTVVGIPRGGLKLAKALEKYRDFSSNIYLIVDDVLTTGKSMEEMKKIAQQNYKFITKGIVIFARKECPNWIHPIFKM